MKLYNIMWLMIFVNIGIILVTTLGIWNVFEGLTLSDFVLNSIGVTALSSTTSALVIASGGKYLGIDVTDMAVYGSFIIFTTAIFTATSSIFRVLASEIGAESYVNLILIVISVIFPLIAIMQMKTGGWENYK